MASHAGDGEISNALKKAFFRLFIKRCFERRIIESNSPSWKWKKIYSDEIAEILSQNHGQEELTNTEKIVLRMIVGAMSNKEIAFALDVSENTVKTHVKYFR